MKPKAEKVLNVGRSIGQGATFGQGSHIAGLGQALGGSVYNLLHKENPFKDVAKDYTEGREEFKKEYAEEISKLANKLSNGSVIVQKYGDILKGRRSTVKRIDEGFVRPTLKEAVPGDLGLILPYVTMKSLTSLIDVITVGTVYLILPSVLMVIFVFSSSISLI